MDTNNSKETLWLLHEKYGGEETPEFFEDLKRIESGEPVDYVIGFSTFLGAKIDLSHHPMIPRQETEWWVEKAIISSPNNQSAFRRHSEFSSESTSVRNSPWIPASAGMTNEKELMGERLEILDLFAGSGCIGIALLKNLPNVAVDFGEKDPLLVKQIEKNLKINEIAPERFCVYETDVFQNIPPKKYDFIFANPPYVSHNRKWQVARPVLEHEPHLALFTEDDGLFFVKKLLNESRDFLAPDGKLFIEFDQWQKETIEKLVEDSKFEGGFWKDQNNRWRVIVLSIKS